MSKKALFIVLILFVIFFSNQIYANNPSQNILNFIDEWNQTINKLQIDDELAQEIYLTVSDLEHINDSPEVYNINFINNTRMNINHRDNNNVFILILHEQKGITRDQFIRNNILAVRMGEVLIHTFTEDRKKALDLISNIRLYDYWGENLLNLGVYTDLIHDEDGYYYETIEDDFAIYIDLFDNQKDTLEISYFGSIILEKD